MATRADRRAHALRAVVLAAALLLGTFPAAARAGQLRATPGTLVSVFSGARPGDTILLTTGDYGVFRGAMKPGRVVLQAAPGAKPTIALSFRPATNITIDGMTIRAIDIAGSATKNIVVRNSDVPGQTTLDTDELQNANVLLDRNVHRDWNKTDDCRCGEGRISLLGSSPQPSGITIQRSEFRGGMSDGIQNGSNGTRILHNYFHDLVAGTPEGVHSDAIQLYGSSNTVIRGNFFRDVGAAQIMSPDGADHEIIEDNVFGPGGYPFAITLWSDDGSIIRHNTMARGSCWFNLPCGIIRLGQKSSCPYADSCDRGRDTLIQDNILASIDVAEGQADFTSRSNLFHDASARGAGDLLGEPLFVAGRRPDTYAGHALAPRSPGRGNASDGLDRGIRPAADGLATPPASVRSRAPATLRVISSLRSIRRTGRLLLSVRTTRRGVVRVAGSLRADQRSRDRHSEEVIELRPVSLGRRSPGRRTVAMRIGPRSRRILGPWHSARLSARVVVGSRVIRSRHTLER